MTSSLKLFLTQRKIDNVSIGDTKSDVAAKIGLPQWWEGQPKLTRDQSAIWIYDELQIIFDEENRCDKIAIYLDGREGRDSSLSEPCRQFNDVAFGPATTIGEFLDYLTQNKISFEKQKAKESSTISIIDGAVATFEHKIDFEKSIAEEKRVTSDEELLASLVVN